MKKKIYWILGILLALIALGVFAYYFWQVVVIALIGLYVVGSAFGIIKN